jgi:hypothetical protein
VDGDGGSASSALQDKCSTCVYEHSSWTLETYFPPCAIHYLLYIMYITQNILCDMVTIWFQYSVVLHVECIKIASSIFSRYTFNIHVEKNLTHMCHHWNAHYKSFWVLHEHTFEKTFWTLFRYFLSFSSANILKTCKTSETQARPTQITCDCNKKHILDVSPMLFQMHFYYSPPFSHFH